ncbi:glycosyl transferase family 1 [bacterium]|nr:glycosyl transferase family 1 [bacterium]|tara:strand:- start:2642 stop:3766 length:1125 start_codon:yes stop_codon:yes gene_type:complete
MRLAINAVRAKSGGAFSHLTGIISNIDPEVYGFDEVHLWTHRSMKNILPQKSWLHIYCPDVSNKNIIYQLFWEFFILPRKLLQIECSLLFNVDAGSIARYKTSVTMSRDMLSYEPGELQRYGLSISSLRLLVLRYVQNLSLRNSTGVIFLTKYASKVIQNSCGKLKNIAYIPHGISSVFSNTKFNINKTFNSSLEILYISNPAPYKHQTEVIQAISILKNEGFNVNLTLVGAESGAFQKKIDNKIKKIDPHGEFIKQYPYENQNKLPIYIAAAHIFVFASSCENMPNTLLEAMATGIPIACSNRGPMPEILSEGGSYFNPEDPTQIAKAVKTIITDEPLRKFYSERSRALSSKYSWERCAAETFIYLSKIASIK